MDRFLPDPRALHYVARLARLTEIRAYVRAQFLRENADVDWTEIGAKVKGLIDRSISAEVREMMEPVSILDSDFEQKIAALPHDDARASMMEHAIRAQISERIGENPVFYERLSAQLMRIIEALRNRLIDSAEACRQYAEVREQIRGESDTAARHGLSPVSYAICELLDGRSGESDQGTDILGSGPSHVSHLDDNLKNIALTIEGGIYQYVGVVDWQTNLEVQRQMRRDIKRRLRPELGYSEEHLDGLANQIVELARRRSAR